MKFAKSILLSALLLPTVAAAQPAPPPAPLSLVPTNFVFLAPIVTSFIVVPFLLNDTTDSTTSTR